MRHADMKRTQCDGCSMPNNAAWIYDHSTSYTCINSVRRTLHRMHWRSMVHRTHERAGSSNVMLFSFLRPSVQQKQGRNVHFWFFNGSSACRIWKPDVSGDCWGRRVNDFGKVRTNISSWTRWSRRQNGRRQSCNFVVLLLVLVQ